MSVKKDKTLVSVRTFAQDFKEHTPSGQTDATPDTVAKNIPKKSDTTPAPKKKPEPVITPKKTEKEPSSTKSIPAFHELQKEIKDVQIHAKKTVPKEASVVVKKKAAKHKKQIPTGDATVITAKRKSTGRASERSFLEGIVKWFAGFKKSFRKKKAPTYVVGGADRRKGVIKKATTKSGAIFTADNETIREEILRRRSAQPHELDVSWSPHTDPGYALLEEPDAAPPVSTTQNVQVSFKQRATPEPTPVEPRTEWKHEPVETTPPPETPTPPPVAEPAPSAQPAETTPVQTPPEEPQEIPPQEAPAEEPERDSDSIQELPDTQLIPNVGPYQEETGFSLEDLRPLLHLEFSKVSTNIIALLVLSIIALSLIAVVSAQTIYNLFNPETAEPTLAVSAGLVTDTIATDVVLQATTSLGLRTAIDQSDALASLPIQEFRFLESPQRVLPPQTMFALLDFETSANFNQTTSALHILVIDNVQHALAIQVTDPITALGSLYNWEPDMREDLAGILNSKNLPDSATTFVDDTIGQTDVRILTDGVDEILVYGFVSENTILITKTSASFERIVTK
jgi:outer membrane biosynthesis protein TonB